MSLIACVVFIGSMFVGYWVHHLSRPNPQNHVPVEYVEFDSSNALMLPGDGRTCSECGMDDTYGWPSFSDGHGMVPFRCNWCRELDRLNRHLARHATRRQ